VSQDHPAGNRLRIDRWLWCARFFKTRALAAQAVSGGRVHLNGERVKPAHLVRIGDHVSLTLDGVDGTFDVLGLPTRRGPATEARRHYNEQPESQMRRARHRELHQLADQTRPRPVTRPDKRDRRRLVRFQRGED
jgi:ribosome-associated heat shock protein Hsp15